MSNLSKVKADLSSIISDLQIVAGEISKSASGIGTERCVASINSVVEKYQVTLNSLNSIDQSLFDEGYEEDTKIEET